MIVKMMTKKEALQEIRKDDAWILGRLKGLSNKNSKKLKSKFVKNYDVMSISEYDIPETKDTAVVYAFKLIHELKGKEYAELGVAYYIKTTYNTYILPCIESFGNKVIRYVEFSPHSVSRIQERLHKDFDTFFKEDYLKMNKTVFHLKKYDYNNDENEYVAHVGSAFIIVDRDGVKDAVKTVLTNKELYSNQLKLKLDSKKVGESFLREHDMVITAEHERNLKIYKKVGALCAIP